MTILILTIDLFLLVIILSILSNPYARFNRVKNPFITKFENGKILLQKKFALTIKASFFRRVFAYSKCAWHIISNLNIKKKAKSKNLEGIISDIHKLRFNPQKPYLISGDHFNVFYPRNLGVFYLATIDPRTALDQSDWENRQRIYLQSTAYALEAFAKNGDCTTTIVPTGSRDVTCINIYRYPSDSLHGILFALSALIDNSFIIKNTPFENNKSYKQNTSDSAKRLLNSYGVDISNLVNKYYKRVFDEKTGLVKKNIHICSAKDITARQSAFYDNVIFWKTFVLAKGLGINNIPKLDLEKLKANILKTYWYQEGGYFIEDLSETSLKEKYYSADWLAALFTGFLDVNDETERKFLERSVEYTISEKIDLPFPLRYQQTDRATRQFFLVRYTVPSYGGSSIWSFWGAEYIKLLVLLANKYKEADNNAKFTEYMERAQKHIQSYENNMIKYRGYPETYNNEGEMLKNNFYISIRQTGWVVDFEQAVELFKYCKN